LIKAEVVGLYAVGAAGMVSDSIHRRAFTLVEILIVVVILAILAAIVVPQFVGATNSSQSATAMAQLQMIRSQLQLYQGQHNAFPDLSAGWAQLTGRTDANGNSNTTGPYGPYLQSAPVNPFTNSTAVTQQSDTNPLPAPAHSDTNGWYYNTTTGDIEAARFNEIAQQGL
jgi:type II secretion system protein G